MVKILWEALSLKDSSTYLLEKFIVTGPASEEFKNFTEEMDL